MSNREDIMPPDFFFFAIICLFNILNALKFSQYRFSVLLRILLPHLFDKAVTVPKKLLLTKQGTW